MISLLQVMHTAKYRLLKSNQATKTVKLTYTSKQTRNYTRS